MKSVVIKPQSVPRMPTGLLRLDLRDVAAEAAETRAAAAAEAAAILSEAQSRASAIVARANAELQDAQRVRARAQEQGRAEGLATGHAEGQERGAAEGLAAARAEFGKQQGPLVAELAAMLDEVAARRGAIYAAANHDVVVLAIAIAERVAGAVARIDPTVAEASADKALLAARGCSRVTLRVAPAALERIERYVGELARRGETRGEIRVVADAAIAPGGVTAATESGEIDATLETQLARVADELVGDWRSRSKALGLSAAADEAAS